MTLEQQIAERIARLRCQVEGTEYIQEPNLIEEIFGQDFDLTDLVFGGFIPEELGQY